MEPESSESQTTTATTASDGFAADSDPLKDISKEVRSLYELTIRGSWRTILDKVSRARSLSLLRFPHEHLVYLSFNAIALTKLRRFSEALEDIESLEKMDSPAYKYESYPQIYPNRSGSMIPFALRWLNALLPSMLNRRAETLDRLYLLLEFVRSRFSQSQLSSALIWKRREEMVMGTIISQHCSQKEFGVCLSLLKDMTFNPVLMSKLGYVQLQFGDLEGAKLSFDQVEKLVITQKDSNLSEVQVQNLVGRNKALMYMVDKDYVSAVREYDDCIERDGSDVVAINNKALCLMYLRDLSASIKVLENSLERVPTVALNETLVVNLCSMYELAYVNHADIKRTLSNWISRLAPDDFDSSCTRI